MGAIENLLPEVEPPGPAGPASKSAAEAATFLVQVGRPAMACEFQVLLNAGQHTGATEAALEALDLVEALEAQLSWFRPDSELSHINQCAADQWVEVEPRFFALLQEAVAIHEQTAGAFDITASPLWKLWGFHRRQGRMPTADDVAAILQQVGSRWLKLDSITRAVRFDRAGIEITLGAVGKGYALDRCAELLGERGVANFLIHGGHSSMLARGSRATEANVDGGWTIALRHPLRHEQRLAEIILRDRALGTSGSGNQFFHFGGRRLGHILDPRTGYPAEGLLSATVLAPTAAQADALSTAFFVLGVERAIEFCRTRPDLGALFVAQGPQTGALEFRTCGLAEHDWRRLG